MSSANECTWCHGSGFILEDKSMYYYFGSDAMRRAHELTDEKRKAEAYEQIDQMKVTPMQPLATECPKCKGTGRINEQRKTM